LRQHQTKIGTQPIQRKSRLLLPNISKPRNCSFSRSSITKNHSNFRHCLQIWMNETSVVKSMSFNNLWLLNTKGKRKCKLFLLEWSLDGPLSKLCPIATPSIQDDCHY
jgi:hypothetical protein